ncbi:MAG: GNAT family N-acetyltransferase [Actinophytocola sp.]|nr:GNAT family N-acetyltransferase [Actinophytocola sp.]
MSLPHVLAIEPATFQLRRATADESVVGTMQLTFIPGLARQGALRAQIEAVRVREDCRSFGLGRAVIQWAIDEARRRGCALVQLTSDKQRTDAHRFYARLGFVDSHEGLISRLARRKPVCRMRRVPRQGTCRGGAWSVPCGP